MEKELLHSFAKLENEHWWFIGRRRIVRRELEAWMVSGERNVLEIGCGMGGNLSMLNGFGKLTATECDDHAIDYSRSLNICPIESGYLPDGLPASLDRQDLIVLLDVLEHVEDDLESLVTLKNLLTPTGKILLTVPALDLMWSDYDVANHHFRRYNRKRLRTVVEMSGLKVQSLYYFNMFLFPLAFIQRKLILSISKESLLPRVPPKPLNKIFEQVFSGERLVAPKIRFPFGLSLMCVATRV